jgi:hypothetical protein
MHVTRAKSEGSTQLSLTSTTERLWRSPVAANASGAIQCVAAGMPQLGKNRPLASSARRCQVRAKVLEV